MLNENTFVPKRATKCPSHPSFTFFSCFFYLLFSRLATTRRKHFQDAVNHLLGEEEDGLGEELQEAAENVKNVLEKLPEEPQPTNTTAVVGVSS